MKKLTLAELQRLPATVDLITAARALGSALAGPMMRSPHTTISGGMPRSGPL
jgi:hypothetical protein